MSSSSEQQDSTVADDEEDVDVKDGEGEKHVEGDESFIVVLVTRQEECCCLVALVPVVPKCLAELCQQGEEEDEGRQDMEVVGNMIGGMDLILYSSRVYSTQQVNCKRFARIDCALGEVKGDAKK